jgi:anti-anti-sigma factor
MSASEARYTQENGTWFIRLSGDIRHPLGPALNGLLDRAFAAPDTAGFLVDLSETENIDSTCLGILARIANWCVDREAAPPIIITTREDVTETLRAVCFDRLFELRDRSPEDTAGLREITPPPSGTAQMSELVLEAHRRLCAVDEQNKAVFQSVVEALERETAARPEE